MTTLDGLNDDFRDLISAFVDCNVDFIVVDAFALAFHGGPRASGDIDLFVRADTENATRVVKRLCSLAHLCRLMEFTMRTLRDWAMCIRWVFPLGASTS